MKRSQASGGWRYLGSKSLIEFVGYWAEDIEGFPQPLKALASGTFCSWHPSPKAGKSLSLALYILGAAFWLAISTLDLPEVLACSCHPLDSVGQRCWAV